MPLPLHSLSSLSLSSRHRNAHLCAPTRSLSGLLLHRWDFFRGSGGSPKALTVAVFGRQASIETHSHRSITLALIHKTATHLINCVENTKIDVGGYARACSWRVMRNPIRQQRGHIDSFKIPQLRRVEDQPPGLFVQFNCARNRIETIPHHFSIVPN